jgi:hypothetical protein
VRSFLPNTLAALSNELVTESMGLSTERKVFVGLFLVAGGALVIDQAVLGPKSAGAGIIDSVATMAEEAISEPIEQAKDEAKSTAAELLNERLNSVTDSFASEQSMSSMFGMPSIDELPVTINTQEQSIGSIEPIVQTSGPMLSAVMPASNGGAAVIDGVLIRSGHTTADGYRLITVRQRSVVLEKEGTEYALTLPAFGG